jgi:nicotinate-nucleotide adenylyltransferase
LNKTIGILGGTFDPPHWGHIHLAVHFAKRLKLDELMWLPSGEPWQKGTLITPAIDRHAMTLAAAEVLKIELQHLGLGTRVTVNTMEIDRAGPSYTIDSAKALRQIYGDQISLIWLMGADSFLQLYTWNDWRDLMHYIHLAVASRPPYRIQTQLHDHQPLLTFYQEHQCNQIDALGKKACGLIYLDEELSIDLASSSLRPLLTQHPNADAIQQWLPESVWSIILEKGFYQSKVR